MSHHDDLAARVRAWASYLAICGAFAINDRRTPAERRRSASLGGKAAARAMTKEQVAARARKGAATWARASVIQSLTR